MGTGLPCPPEGLRAGDLAAEKIVRDVVGELQALLSSRIEESPLFRMAVELAVYDLALNKVAVNVFLVRK